MSVLLSFVSDFFVAPSGSPPLTERVVWNSDQHRKVFDGMWRLLIENTMEPKVFWEVATDVDHLAKPTMVGECEDFCSRLEINFMIP